MIRTRTLKNKKWFHLADFARAIGIRNLHQSVRNYTGVKNLRKFGTDSRSSVWINSAGILDTWSRSKKCHAAFTSVLHEGEPVTIDTIDSIVDRLGTPATPSQRSEIKKVEEVRSLEPETAA